MLLNVPVIFSQHLKKGEIIDAVPVGSGNETYAVYLPKAYQVNQPSSIVFIFEPLGRGLVGIDPFISASEEFNHILICSNNAKNGPFEVNFEIANRLFASVFETFQIDQKQIYLAGFSGGSRLASSIAVLTQQIQGVIACGAGFSPNSYHQPSFNHKFSYVGLVGTRDMNYQEMHQTEKWLEILNMDKTLFINDDRHRWPPSPQIRKAFAWLELRAFERNLKTKNFDFIQTAYTEFYQHAKTNEQAGRLVEAVYAYERLERDFRGYFNIDSIRSKINTLKQLRSYKEAITSNKELAEEERVIKNMFDGKFAAEIQRENATPKTKWWSKKIERLNNNFLKSDNRFKKALGERINYSVYALGIETGQIHLRNKNFKKALYCHEVLAILLPESPLPSVLIAKDYALMGLEKPAISHLETAFQKGASIDVLQHVEFEALSARPAFKKLLEKKELTKG